MSAPQSDPAERTAGYELALIAQDVRRLIEGQYRIEKFLTGNGDPSSGLLFKTADNTRQITEIREEAKARNTRVNAWLTAAIAAAITALVGVGVKAIASGNPARASDHNNASK